MRWAVLGGIFNSVHRDFSGRWSYFLQTGSGVFSCGCCGCSCLHPASGYQRRAGTLTYSFVRVLPHTCRHLDTRCCLHRCSVFVSIPQNNLMWVINCSLSMSEMPVPTYSLISFLYFSHISILWVFVKNCILDHVFDTPTVWSIPVVQMKGSEMKGGGE